MLLSKHVSLLVGLLLSPLVFQNQAHSATSSSEMKSVIAKLPDKKLSIDLILAKAFASSDSAAIVKSEMISADSVELSNQAAYDLQIFANASYAKKDEDTMTVFDAKDQTTYLLGVSKYFSSGTNLALEFGQVESTLSPSNTFSEEQSSYAKLSLTQNLLKDSFGMMSRASSNAAQAMRKANEYNVENNVEEWMQNIIQLYYSVWYAQEEVRSADLSLARQKRLLDISKLKLQRGTTEKVDFLQIENSFYNTQIRYNTLKLNVQNVWGELVSALKLPEHWRQWDAMQIPLSIENNNERSISLCADVTNKVKAQDLSVEQKLIKAQLDAAKSSLDASQSNMLPQLNLEASLTSKDYNDEVSERWSNVTSNQSSDWMLALNFKMPISNSAEKAQYKTSYANLQRAQAMYSQANSQFETKWLNECAILNNTKQNLEILANVIKNAELRSKLDEQRFRNGQTNTINVIQSGEDLTAIELQYYQQKISFNQSNWKILELNSDLKAYLEKNLNKFANFSL